MEAIRRDADASQKSDPSTMDVDDDSPTGSSPTGSAPTGSGRSPLQSLDDKLAIIKLHLTKTGVKKKKKNDEVTLVT